MAVKGREKKHPDHSVGLDLNRETRLKKQSLTRKTANLPNPQKINSTCRGGFVSPQKIPQKGKAILDK